MCRALDEMFEESTNKGIQMGIKQGIELNQFEVYQTMLDKGFSIKTIASIFSVSEESIKNLLMKADLDECTCSTHSLQKREGRCKSVQSIR